jgi:hypothetical protein
VVLLTAAGGVVFVGFSRRRGVVDFSRRRGVVSSVGGVVFLAKT